MSNEIFLNTKDAIFNAIVTEIIKSTFNNITNTYNTMIHFINKIFDEKTFVNESIIEITDAIKTYVNLKQLFEQDLYGNRSLSRTKIRGRN